MVYSAEVLMRLRWIADDLNCSIDELLSAIECNIVQEEIKMQLPHVQSRGRTTTHV